MDVGTLVIIVIAGLMPACVAHYKGRNFFAWWVFGTMLWIIAMPVSLIMRRMKKCPSCAERVQNEALLCKHCNSSLLKMEDG